MDLDLSISHHLDTRLVKAPLSDHLVATQAGQQLGPEVPVDGTEEEDTDADDGEDVVWVAVGGPAALGRDEGHEDEEDVGEEPEDGDREEGLPWGRPVLALGVLKVDETASDKGVDPGSRVSIPEGEVSRMNNEKLW